MDYSHPGSSVHGISQARILEWLPLPSPGDLPDPGIEPMSPTLAGGFFTNEPPVKPQPYYYRGIYMNKMIEQNHVAPPSSQDEALSRYSASGEVPR